MKEEAKTLTPKLRFPEFRSAKAWERRKLSDLLVENRQRNRQLKYGPEDVLSVSGEYGCVNQIEFLGRSYAGLSVSDYHVVETGDIVYTKSPLKKNPFGVIKENKGEPGIVSTLYAVYRATSKGHPAYLDHYFSRDYNLNSYLQPIVRKGAKNDMKVNNSAVLGGEIITPSIEEQKKIADFLTSKDEMIAAERRKLEALQAHKKGLMQQLFPREGETCPRLRFPKFRDATKWSQKILGNEGEFLTSLSGKAAADFDTGQARFIPYSNVFENTFVNTEALRRVDVNDDESQNIVRKDDVFFTVSSETQKDAGMSSVLLEDIAGCYLNSFCALFRFFDDRKPNSRFAGYLFRSEPVRSYLAANAQGAIRYNISRGVFRDLAFLVPTRLEQEAIADILSTLDVLIAAQVRKLDGLRARKQGLMQQLFVSSEGV